MSMWKATPVACRNTLNMDATPAMFDDAMSALYMAVEAMNDEQIVGLTHTLALAHKAREEMDKSDPLHGWLDNDKFLASSLLLDVLGEVSTLRIEREEQEREYMEFTLYWEGNDDA